MDKIFSRANPEILLHIIHQKGDFSEPRFNLSTEEEYIQARTILFSKDEEVPAHKHLEIDKVGKLTQEVLIIIEGELEASYYDIDNSFIKKIVLKEGDCAVTFRGGHSFKALTNNTKLYEVKNGPYYGKEKDKVGI